MQGKRPSHAHRCGMLALDKGRTAGRRSTWRVSKNSQPTSGLPSSCVGGMASVLEGTRSCSRTPLGSPRALPASFSALHEHREMRSPPERWLQPSEACLRYSGRHSRELPDVCIVGGCFGLMHEPQPSSQDAGESFRSAPGLSQVAVLAQLKARHGAGGLAALPRHVQRDALKGALRLDGGLRGRAGVVVPASPTKLNPDSINHAIPLGDQHIIQEPSCRKCE